MKNCFANDRELLGLIQFLERFKCYLERCSFEILTDNQIFKNFISKSSLTQHARNRLGGVFEADWHLSNDTAKRQGSCLGRRNVTSTSHCCRKGPIRRGLKRSKIEIDLPPNIIKNYDSDQLFGPIYTAAKGIFPDDKNHKDGLLSTSFDFEIENKLLFLSREEFAFLEKMSSTF